jgi:hypothetical protein
MSGLTLNGQQDVFRSLTPTMRVLTEEEIYDVSGGDPGVISRWEWAFKKGWAFVDPLNRFNMVTNVFSLLTYSQNAY